MVCFTPLSGFLRTDFAAGRSRRVVFRIPLRPSNSYSYEPVKVPCGQCSGCKTKRAIGWAVRCLHESKLHRFNSFITLTYDKAYLPIDSSLDVVVFQKFMKRLRKHTGVKLRFYQCGEYGSKNGRPHYHAIIFGFDFPDKVFWKKSPSGEDLFRSPLLEKAWKFGFSSIGSVTIESAFYVAQYCQDKLNVSDKSPETLKQRFHDKYDFVLPDGEIITRKQEYSTQSRRPGIGRGAFDKWHGDWFHNDFVVCNGSKLPIPRYYDNLYEHLYPQDLEDIKFTRIDNAMKCSDDNTVERLAVRRVVSEARRKLYSKEL